MLMAVLLRAQTTEQAWKLLDELSAAYTEASALDIRFLFLPDAPEHAAYMDTTRWDAAETITGQLLLQGDKFRLYLPDMDILYDGDKMYQFLPEVLEINMTQPKDTDGAPYGLFARPRQLLSGYRRNFEVSSVKTVRHQGVALTEIRLSPQHQLQQTYRTVTLWIDNRTRHLAALRTEQVDDVVSLIALRSIQPVEIQDVFEFQLSKYPQGTELIDMTF